VAVVTVEEVSGRAAYKRFVEFPYLTFRDEPRWSPPLASYERSRLDPHNPFFDRGDGEYFLARRGGVVAGRVTAHIAAKGDAHGWFGFFDVIDDEDVARALVDRAAVWLQEHGCTSMAGPASFTPADGPGVLVDGFDVAGTTGRPWQPPWYAKHLAAAGLARTGEQHTWRLRPDGGPALVERVEKPRVPMVGRFVDPRIVLRGITAVPDLSPARGSGVALARLAKRRQWDTCTVIAIDGDPSALVPNLQAAASEYDWVISPWSPDAEAPPEATHARFTIDF
jgi:hypothetical protein